MTEKPKNSPRKQSNTICGTSDFEQTETKQQRIDGWGTVME